VGLRDERIAATARDLFALALEAAAALGPTFICPADVEEARAFFETYTARALSPADDALAELASGRKGAEESHRPQVLMNGG
jgi:hypothetical protein